MRKPISKNGLRRAFESVVANGYVQCSEPVNSVIDRIWHEMERENYEGTKRRAPARETVRAAAIPSVIEQD